MVEVELQKADHFFCFCIGTTLARFSGGESERERGGEVEEEG